MAFGQFEKSEALLRQGLDLSRSLGDRIGTANCLYNLGSVVGFANDFMGHETAYREALAIRREMGERAGVAMNLGGLAISSFLSWRLCYSGQTGG